jgi:malate dehydrogenase (oxaloacetate-decarboxylating)(NADP+)
MLLADGQVDAALCGGLGSWQRQLGYVMPIIPQRADVSRIYSLSALILPKGALFFCDTHVNIDPNAEQIAEMTVLAAHAVRRFGVHPKAALLSHSSFGASHSACAHKMRDALAILRQTAPELEVDGEMHADAALSEALRHRLVSASPLTGSANPLLLGASQPLHVMVSSVTARGIVNMTALAVAQAAGAQ